MARNLFVLIFFVITLAWHPAAAQTKHMYVNGLIQAVSGDTVTLGGEVFVLHPKSKVYLQTYSNGAYHELKGRLNDVVPGLSANVKVTGKVISEISIERWKQ